MLSPARFSGFEGEKSLSVDAFLGKFSGRWDATAQIRRTVL